MSDSDPAMLRYLDERGVALGDELEVLERQPFDGPLTVRFGDNLHVLGGTLARAMRVERAQRRASRTSAARTPGGYSCGHAADTPRSYTPHDVKDAPMTLTYRVDGMSCEHCVVAVTGEVGGVAGVAVGRRRPRARKLVRVSGAGIDDAAVVAAIDEAGYDAVPA